MILGISSRGSSAPANNPTNRTAATPSLFEPTLIEPIRYPVAATRNSRRIGLLLSKSIKEVCFYEGVKLVVPLMRR